MSNQVQKLLAGGTTFAVLAAILIWQPAQARGGYLRGARGAAGGWARQGVYGQSAGYGARAYGKGGFFGTAASGTGPGGSTYKGFRRGRYNAQTGTGAYSSGKSVYDAKNGNTYGYSQDTAFTKGSGAQTSLDTQNKGDYTIDWSKGAKPVVTPVAPQ
jgi:hypothetical protein